MEHNIEQENKIKDNFFIKLNKYFSSPKTCIMCLCACILALIIFGMLMWVQKDLLIEEKPKIKYIHSYFSNIPYDL